MNVQTLELDITLNEGDSLPEETWGEIVDAIEERLESISGTGEMVCEKFGIGHICYKHKGQVLDEYCGC
jgi:hypothetical protein